MSESKQATPNETQRTAWILGIVVAIYDLIILTISQEISFNFPNKITMDILSIARVVLFNLVFIRLARGLDKQAGLFRILFIVVMIYRVIDGTLDLAYYIGHQFSVPIPTLSTLLGITMNFVVYWLLFSLPLILMLVLYLMSKKLIPLHRLLVAILLGATLLKIFFNIPVTGVNNSNAALAMAIIFDTGLILWCVQRLIFPNLGRAPATSATTATVVAVQSAPPVGETAVVFTPATGGMKPSTIASFTEPTGSIKRLPTLTYWCDKCNKQVGGKALNSKGMTKDELRKPQKCPTCGTTLKVFWVYLDKKTYIQFILVISFMAGAMWISMLPPVILDYVNLYAARAMLGGTIFCAIVFILIMVVMKRTKPKLAARPENATEIPSLAPMDMAGKEILFLVIFAIGGSLVIFGIFWAIFFG